MTQQTDSLKVAELDDGTFDISWDTDDPMWCFLNDMTEEQRSEWFNKAIELGIERSKPRWTIPVEEDPITGEQFLTFPEECIEKLKWQEGDTVEWIDNFDGTFTVRKVLSTVTQS
jgi:hypothetical protein